MGVNKETQVETKKRSVWVLTYSRERSGQRGNLNLKVYMDKPTIIDLARYFQEVEEIGEEIPYACVMSALVFLDDLVNGGGRKGAEASWYTLEEVTES